MSIFRRFRDHVGWTQAQLAEAIQVKRSAVSNYESGMVPHRSVAYRFLDVCADHQFPATLEDVQPRETA